jgi:enoyl-CoA hydratase/carnithine racemase
LELLLTARPLNAARALEVGLVNRVVPAAELRGAAQRLATTIAANAPLSLQAAKRMVYASAGLDRRAALEEGWRLFEPVYLSEDAQEGPSAFLERRAPRWRGR